MCGIAGVVSEDESRVAAMLDRLGHRGPDGRGIARGGCGLLGCTRLAMRGERAGEQPLRTRRGLLVYNGEVYNAAELVKDLAWHGIEVDPESDTAVVGALLDVYGIRAVDRLNGMYALAFDDGERVYLARDPAGIKPLHYRGDAFASEIAPLLDDRPRIHGPALSRWLTFHVAYGCETFFRDVRRVPPGGIVELPGGRVLRPGDHALRITEPNPGLDAPRLRKILRRAVEGAVPDEPFGVSLSGGLDSTLVAALAHGEATAFHGRVDAPGCDESPHARAAAKELGIELVEVEIDAARCLEALPRVVRALEEPVAGPGSLAQFLVAERAAQSVRVLLSGCGGDELFSGYARAVALVRDEPPPGLEAYAPLFDRVRGKPPVERALAALDRRAPALYRADFLEAHPAPEAEFREAFLVGGLAPPAAAARAEIEIILPALLSVEDRVAMAFGLEGRVPLLDRRLLRVAARLAPEQRVDASGRPKALLRAAAAPLLPDSVRRRTDKMGFPLPLGDWFAGPWRSFSRDVLLDRRTRERGMIEPAGVERALTGPSRYDRGLFGALFLELWCRAYLDE